MAGKSGVRARMVKAGMLPRLVALLPDPGQIAGNSGVHARMVKAGMVSRMVAWFPDPVDSREQRGARQDGEGWHATEAGGSTPRPR